MTEWLDAKNDPSIKTENRPVEICSMVLINPCTHRPFRQIKPFLRESVFRPSAFFYKLRPSRVVIRFCGRFVLDVFGCPLNYNNFDNLMLTLTTILNCKQKTVSIVFATKT